MRRQRDNERRRGGSAEVWRSLDGAAFTAPLFKATVQPKFVCTLMNIRMRNLVGVAMRSRFGALDHDIRRVRFAPSTDIVSLAGHVRKVPTADMPSLPNVVMPTNRKPPRSGFSH